MGTLFAIALAVSVFWLIGRHLKMIGAIESLKAEKAFLRASIEALNTTVASLSSASRAADNALHERVCNLENQQ